MLLCAEYFDLSWPDWLDWLQKLVKSKIGFLDAITWLSRYALIDVTEKSESHSIHAVLHRWCSRLTTDQEMNLHPWLVASVVGSWIDNFDAMQDFWNDQKRLLPHIIATNPVLYNDYMIALGKVKFQDFKIDLIANFLCFYSHTNPDGQEVTQLSKQSLKWLKNTTIDDLRHSFWLYWLGISCREAGDLDEAERLLQRVLKAEETRFGREHDRTLYTVKELAGDQGKQKRQGGFTGRRFKA